MATQPITEDLGGQMSIWEHLRELRSRLFKCLIAVAIGVVVAWMLYPRIFDLLVGPLQDNAEGTIEGSLFALDPLEPFGVRIKIATYTGIMFAMPVLLWQLWRFISPGLYRNEKKYAVLFVGFGMLLFVMGAAIAFWTLPKALEFLQAIGGDGFTEAYSAAKYLRLVVYMMLAFGLGFEFPILLVFLQLVGLVTTSQLRQFRRYAIVGISVVVAVITPSADPISMLALTIPMVLFYEIAIIIGRIRERRLRLRGAA
jgi:sec-independent protein translocase protein TatC